MGGLKKEVAGRQRHPQSEMETVGGGAWGKY